MPRHRRRHGVSRLLLPAVVGAMALATVGSVVTGTLFPPGSADEVGAVQGIVSVPDLAGATRPDPMSADIPLSTFAPASPTPDLAAAKAPAVADHRPLSPSALTGYQWPLPHGRITLPFGPSEWGSRIVDGQAFHDGLDVATFCGDRIVAAHAGTVLAAGRRYDVQMGWIGDLTPYLNRLEAKSLWSTLPIVVVIDDGNGYRSIYAHLSKAAVKRGQAVEAGQFIGYEGKTGRASGCHLHYGLFSPDDSGRFGIDPGVVERMKLPGWQVARIDPLLVLPERPTGNAAPELGHPAPGATKPPLE